MLHVAGKFDCSCDNVKGCVPFASTTGSSMYATAGKWMSDYEWVFILLS